MQTIEIMQIGFMFMFVYATIIVLNISSYYDDNMYLYLIYVFLMVGFVLALCCLSLIEKYKYKGIRLRNHNNGE